MVELFARARKHQFLRHPAGERRNHTGRGLLGVLLDVKVLERAATDCFIRLGRVVRRCVDPRKVGAKDCGPVEMVSHTAVLKGVLGRKDGQFGLMTLICRW